MSNDDRKLTLEWVEHPNGVRTACARLCSMQKLGPFSSRPPPVGPLIAGASIVGVAIGFGAQTFVRDVIAGMFYLLDDAFRVGEYIQSGNYKGTVEGFSIR